MILLLERAKTITMCLFVRSACNRGLREGTVWNQSWTWDLLLFSRKVLLWKGWIKRWADWFVCNDFPDYFKIGSFIKENPSIDLFALQKLKKIFTRFPEEKISTIYPNHPIQKLYTPQLLMDCVSFLSISEYFHPQLIPSESLSCPHFEKMCLKIIVTVGKGLGKSNL